MSTTPVSDSYIAYLLVCVAEEAGEVGKEALKAVRFGLDTEWNGSTPRQRLLQEVADLFILLDQLGDCVGIKGQTDDILKSPPDDDNYISAKLQRLKVSMDDSRKTGLLKPL